jgi:type III restriction enzyme
VLETKGYDPRLDVKRAAAERWVAAVNADGRFGTWDFALARSMEQVREALEGRGHPPTQSA